MSRPKGGLVHGEQHQAEGRICAEALQDRAQRARVVGGQRQVVAGVGPVDLQRGPVVVPQHPRVQLHHHAVLARHLLRTRRACRPGRAAASAGLTPPARAAAWTPLGLAGLHRLARGVDRSVVGGGAAVLGRTTPVAPAGRRGGRHAWRCPPRWPPPARPGRRASRARPGRRSGRGGRWGSTSPGQRRLPCQRLVGGQRRRRVVGGGQGGDPEALEQRPGPVGRRGQPFAHLVEDRVGGARRRRDGHPEQLGELALQPVSATACPRRPPTARTAPAHTSRGLGGAAPGRRRGEGSRGRPGPPRGRAAAG